MNIKDLISEGEQVKQKNLTKGTYGSDYISGLDYEKWIAKCVVFLQRSNYNKEMTGRFIETSKKAVGNEVKYYDNMMGIIMTFDEMGEEDPNIF